MKQLEYLNTTMTAVLIEQGKLATLMEQSIADVKTKNEVIMAQADLIRDHESRVTKIEGVVKTLGWVAGILSGTVIAIVVRIVNNIIGG